MARRILDPPIHTHDPLRMSYHEWLAWSRSDGPMSEWVDGEVIVFMPPTTVHHHLLAFLFEVTTRYVRRLHLGQVFDAPYEMRLPELKVSREPDLAFLAAEHASRVSAKRLEGPADLVIEIVSDDSVARDRIHKRAEYAAAGIPEYLILDPRPRQQRAEFLRLGPDGRYREGPRDAAGRYHSLVVPGFWLDPAWLWQAPLPDPDEILDAIMRG